ncbi:MAG: lysophospholipid acyltransferase family protein [Pseudomonadota bacterium]
MVTWYGTDPPPASARISIAGWICVVLRGLPIGAVLSCGFVLVTVLRPIERVVWGPRWPLTPWISQCVCRAICAVLGLKLQTTGRPVALPGAVVANHVTWLDVLVLNAQVRGFFVAKADVKTWPVISGLARAGGTVFFDRSAKAARRETEALAERVRAGHRLVIFPEGTSSDGRRVLRFKSTVFEAFFADGVPPGLHIQPVTLFYEAPQGRDSRFYGWWGRMGLTASMLAVLAQMPQGAVQILWHEPVAVAGQDRKSLALSCQSAVEDGFTTAAHKAS